MNKSTEEQDRNSAEAGSRYIPVESRISKLAILSLVLGIFSLPFFVLAGLPAIVVGIISIVRVRRSRGQLKGKAVALAGMLISIPLMYTFFLLWSLDAPPIPNDYTVADLRSAPAEYAESFEILKTLIDEGPDLPGAPAMGLTEADVEMIDEITNVIRRGTPAEIAETLRHHANDVERAWENAQRARDAIHQLNEFAEIADLTEPDPLVRLMYMRNLVRLVRLYQAYAHLQTEQEDIHAFVTQLIELYSIIKKIGLNVRPFIGKLFCKLAVTIDIRTANTIANNPASSRESVELLANHFTPLTAEQVSMRNCALFEYLFTRAFADGLERHDFKDQRDLFKKNSALRWYRNLYDVGINSDQGSNDATSRKFSVWPDIYPFKEPASFDNFEPLPLLYTWYNPEGSRFIRMFKVPFKSREIVQNRMAILILDDLLQIVLNKRLGKEVSLKARAYSDEYIVDVENKKIFSPGPDGKTNTKDDIWLPINPEVLHINSL